MEMVSGNAGDPNLTLETVLNTYEQVDGCVDNDVIANKFASYFDSLCKHNNSSRTNALYTEYIDTRQGSINQSIFV
jgi:hypothetical protein